MPLGWPCFRVVLLATVCVAVVMFGLKGYGRYQARQLAAERAAYVAYLTARPEVQEYNLSQIPDGWTRVEKMEHYLLVSTGVKYTLFAHRHPITLRPWKRTFVLEPYHQNILYWRLVKLE